MRQRPIELLLVEDSPGDLWLTREALKNGTVPKNIAAVHNGEEALNYLYRKGAYKTATRPDLILLDLNMPRRDGLEVLRELKSDPNLKAIAVIVLTTSEAASDINAAYDANANCYVVKPVELERFTETVRAIEEFWMRFVALPGTADVSGGAIGSASSGTAADAATANRKPGDHRSALRNMAHRRSTPLTLSVIRRARIRNE